ncbi:haloacid dehalogenase [Aerococcus urinaehominis]|uniref:Haloacid dehalogenase n=1 Tax=Aerococcus urinaehominis TaxID=128944 RepID=A0A109RGP5_9LACT|nr:HAD hydrolase-like protein [Aerococcus urinaehominis]AMB99036.1 haloacid dehalogenase [Aerococcus urinaehominis]SDM50912.1 Phosphoglycolate phosphatase, HAD superfamily [Aerococcus urinaehominis]
MAVLPNEFTKEKDFLFCVDSDGCAMDTMNVKHYDYFGPLAAEVYGIEDKEKFQEDWNRVNLFSSTRGVNRFKALAICLANAKEAGEDIVDITALKQWTDESTSLSNGALEEVLETNSDESLKLALKWSQAVNEGIEKELAGNDKPFPGAKEGLEQVTQVADVAIVSSANGEALQSEWTRHGLMDSVDVVYGQEAGSKAEAIADLLEHGYGKDEILMVGDAPGDLKAAESNGVLFYPILFGSEKESWDRLQNEAADKFLNKEYKGDYQDKVIQEFKDLLAKYD